MASPNKKKSQKLLPLQNLLNTKTPNLKASIALLAVKALSQGLSILKALALDNPGWNIDLAAAAAAPFAWHSILSYTVLESCPIDYVSGDILKKNPTLQRNCMWHFQSPKCREIPKDIDMGQHQKWCKTVFQSPKWREIPKDTERWV